MPRDPAPLQGSVDLGHVERTDTGMRSNQGSVSAGYSIRCGGKGRAE